MYKAIRVTKKICIFFYFTYHIITGNDKIEKSKQMFVLCYAVAPEAALL